MLAALLACALAASVPQVEVDLAAVPLAGDGTVDLALRLRIDEPWHVYWLNPGDSGLPIRVTWTLPEGATVGPLGWPAPLRFAAEGLAGYGYQGEVVLTARATGITDPRTIAASVSWLACAEACVPGRAEVTAQVDPAAADRVAAARSEIPSAPTVEDLHVAEVTRADGVLTIQTAGTLAAAQTDAYPLPIDGLIIDHGAITVAAQHIAIPLRGNAHVLPLVVRCGARTFTLDVPIPP